jgi:sec-independent protein translocase protein TatA
MLNNLLFLSMPSGGEWFLVIAVVVLLFGGKKIPELMRGIGKGMREFNDAKKSVTDEIQAGMNESKDSKESK